MSRFLTLAAALLPAVLAQATSYGCYTDISNGRALTGALLVDYTGMTIEACGTFCAEFPIFGIEYSGECYCGDALAQGSFPTFSTDCSMLCPGDETGTSICGGPNRLSLYGVDAVAPAITPVLADPPTAFTSVGCFTEGDGVRALSGQAGFAPTELTIATCGQYCLNWGYTTFGAEYGAECYCGNELDASSNATDPAECIMPCAGDNTEICGGPNRLSVYLWA
ncbi:WSC domain-containing protein [Bombardia bombarda]|uniref:WSC domain-containing protein n=1 Tax=Bombardia bombarda TaxID=252184 RepID=A0AA40CGK1_9PEZI|nr:WSC domain-containing protein [Bombardia bombarda]